MIKRGLLTLAFTLLGASPPAAPHYTAPETLTPQKIFNATFRRLQSYPVPPYAIWTATWNIRERPMGYYTGEKTSVETNRYAVRLSDGMENVSDPIPSGKLPPAIIEGEFLGPFAWRMRSAVPVAPAGGVMMQPDIEGLKTIATVVAIAQSPYTFGFTSAGTLPIENVDGHRVYHLQLAPRTEPQRHNLRDLWIDVDSYDLWKAHFVGTYRPTPDAPLSPTDVTVNFRNVVGFWVVAHAVWTWDDAPVSFIFDVTNNELGLPDSLPDWLFDAKQYQLHQDAGEPDYIGDFLKRMETGTNFR